MMDINKATLSGAIDILVVEQPDGTFKCAHTVLVAAACRLAESCGLLASCPRTSSTGRHRSVQVDAVASAVRQDEFVETKGEGRQGTAPQATGTRYSQILHAAYDCRMRRSL